MAGSLPGPRYNGWRSVDPTDQDAGRDVYIAGKRVLTFGDSGSTDGLTEGARPGAHIMGAGTSASRVTTDQAGKFISMYFDSSSTGSVEGLYLRQYGSGAGSTVQALRAFTTVSDVAAGNARGAHVSLSFASTGTITGLGAAIDATLHLPDTTPLAGTLTALSLDLNADGATTDPAGATSLSFIRAVMQGNATGIADLDDDAVLIDLSGMTIGSGNLVEASATEANYAHSIKIRLPDGSLGYLMVASAAG